MKTKKETKLILSKLKSKYPEATCSLDFNNAFEMAIAVLLSAQCTDERVNKITPALFKNYNTPEKMNELSVEEIKEYIKSCNFYNNKAKSIKKLSEVLINEYNGKVPNTMKELVKLPGIGRKSANVIMLEAFNDPQGIAVDTHAKRISNRIGLSDKEDPEKIEQDLLKRLDREDYYDANHLFVWHGRYTCKARNPECENCNITEHCNHFKFVIKK